MNWWWLIPAFVAGVIAGWNIARAKEPKPPKPPDPRLGRYRVVVRDVAGYKKPGWCVEHCQKNPFGFVGWDIVSEAFATRNLAEEQMRLLEESEGPSLEVLKLRAQLRRWQLGQQIESDYLTEEDYAELKRLAEDEEPFKRLAKEL